MPDKKPFELTAAQKSVVRDFSQVRVDVAHGLPPGSMRKQLAWAYDNETKHITMRIIPWLQRGKMSFEQCLTLIDKSTAELVLA